MMRTSDLWEYPESQLIEHLQSRGYVIRHKREARTKLSWNRTLPIPKDVDFQQEALQHLRSQLKLEHLEFVATKMPSITATGVGEIEVQSAFLRILA